MVNSTLQSIHKDLIQSHISGKENDEEFLFWMVLIHTHKVCLSSPLADVPNVRVVQPLTQRGAATVIAELWHNRQESEKTSYMYWYRKYQSETPYEKASAIPTEKKQRIEALRKTMESDSRVEALTPV